MARLSSSPRPEAAFFILNQSDFWRLFLLSRGSEILMKGASDVLLGAREKRRDRPGRRCTV